MKTHLYDHGAGVEVLKALMPLVEVLAVEFDHIAVGI
jgi:hypothetical protein